MAEFTPINTQEEFDAMIKSRLDRERDAVRKEFADYASIKDSLKSKTDELTKVQGELSELKGKSTELEAQVKKYETDSAKTRIGLSAGLPYELISRLSGETEDEIKADAEALSKLVKGGNPAPLFNPDSKPDKAGDAALKQMVSKLRG